MAESRARGDLWDANNKKLSIALSATRPFFLAKPWFASRLRGGKSISSFTIGCVSMTAGKDV